MQASRIFFDKFFDTETINFVVALEGLGRVVVWNGTRTMDCSLGGFGDEAGDLPLHCTGGGQAICVFAGGQGAIPDLHADDGEFFGLQGAFVLCDVQSLPPVAGSDAEAEGGFDG